MSAEDTNSGSLFGHIVVSSNAAVAEDAERELQRTADGHAQTLETWARTSENVAKLGL